MNATKSALSVRATICLATACLTFVVSSPLAASTPACDLGGDGLCAIDDIDALVSEIASGSTDLGFDMNGDGLVNLDDRDAWLASAGAENMASQNSYLLGDFTLDGVVDVQDFLVWNANKFQFTGKWSLGDATADGATDAYDFVEWNRNKFTSALTIPEPSGALVVCLGAIMFLGRARRAS